MAKVVIRSGDALKTGLDIASIALFGRRSRHQDAPLPALKRRLPKQQHTDILPSVHHLVIPAETPTSLVPQAPYTTIGKLPVQEHAKSAHDDATIAPLDRVHVESSLPVLPASSEVMQTSAVPTSRFGRLFQYSGQFLLGAETFTRDRRTK
jgi:hypothetical protein